MDLLIDNSHGEQLLFSRLVDWVMNTQAGDMVTLVSLEGESIDVSRNLLCFLSPLVLQIDHGKDKSDKTDKILTPLASDELQVIGDILELQDEAEDIIADDVMARISEGVENLGISIDCFKHLVEIRNRIVSQSSGGIEDTDVEIIIHDDNPSAATAIKVENDDIEIQNVDTVMNSQIVRNDVKTEEDDDITEGYSPDQSAKSSKQTSCNYCPEQFDISTRPGYVSWRLHERKHAVEKFECKCDDTFTNWNEKENHIRLIHEGWEFCDICNAAVSHLEKHMVKHKAKKVKVQKQTGRKQKVQKHISSINENVKRSPKRPGPKRKIFPEVLECPSCGKKYSGKERRGRIRYKIHMKNHETEQFNCGCALQFSSFNERTRHLNIVHKGYFGCSQCNSSFKDMESLTTHEAYHQQNFVCDQCGFSTTKRFRLKKHNARMHTIVKEKSGPSEDDLTCKECRRKCLDKGTLNQHMKRVHNPSPCPECGKIVKNIRVHINNTHMDDSEKKFRCEFCEKGFTSNMNLQSHMMNVHIKSRPHRCRYDGCENIPGYNDISNRNSHEKKKHGKLFSQ